MEILQFFGGFILWVRHKADYFPVVTFIAAFPVAFFLSEVDRRLHYRRPALPDYVPFLKDPLTWFYKVTFIPLGSFVFARLIKFIPENTHHWVLGVIVLFGAIVALVISFETLKKFVRVKISHEEVTDEELGVKENWHNYWWAWRKGEIQVGAVYNNFFIFPSMYFFCAIALGSVVYFPFHFLAGGGEKVLTPILIGNLYVIITGVGMLFNLLYFQHLYKDFYKNKVVQVYIVIYIICAFFGLYGIYITEHEHIIISAIVLMGHAASLVGISFDEEVKTGLTWMVRKMSVDSNIGVT